MMLGIAGQAHAQTDDQCIAANERAVSFDTAGKLLDERKELTACADTACPEVVKTSCDRRLVELTAKIPSIVFDVKDASGRDLTEVRLSIDGVAVDGKLPSTAISLDPGSHRFTFETAGHPAVSETLTLQEGAKDRRESVMIGSLPPPPPTAEPGPTAGPTFSPPPEDVTSGQRVFGLALGGAGFAGLAVGSIFGGLTFSSWGHANSECPSHSGCSTQATSDRSNALTFGTVSTVAFIAGGVLLMGGLTLYLTAPKGRTPGLGVQLAPLGLGMAGGFQ
jgi:hypothetical protein